MTLRHIFIITVIGSMLTAFAFAGPQDNTTGSELFAQGQALLKKGDFDGALKAFIGAAKANPENQEYGMQAMMVRRVQNLRNFVNHSEVTPQWEKAVISLHAFYLTNGIYEEAVALNRTAHKKMNNALSASLLAEALLAAGKHDKALTLLEGLDAEKMDDQNRIYLGIALARSGRLEEAKKQREQVPVGVNTHMGQMFDLARLDTLIGNPDGACTLLTACFERTLPSQLADVKSFANRCPDFAPLKGTPAFAAAMETKSKMTESSCSGGSSCGSCPHSSSCGSQPKAEPEKKGCGGCSKSGSCDKSTGCDKDEGCDSGGCGEK
jgi:hypothetical protein